MTIRTTAAILALALTVPLESALACPKPGSQQTTATDAQSLRLADAGQSGHAGHGHHHAETGVEVAGAWTRATPPGAKVAGGFLKITNTGSEPDRLVGGSFELSERIEIHTMSVENGVMRMAELKDGLEIAPGATVELKPGGYHIMFMGLTGAPKEGATVKGSLKFEKAGDVAVEFAVAPIGAKSMTETGGDASAGGHGAGHHMNHH